MVASDDTFTFDASPGDRAWIVPTVLYRFGRSRLRLVSIGAVASLLYPAFGLLPVYLLQIGIDGVLLATDPFSIPGVPDGRLPVDPSSQLLLLAGLMTTATLSAAVLGALSTRAWGRFAHEVQHDVRTATYESVQSLEQSFFDTEQTGQLLSILNDDVSNLDRLFRSVLKDGLETVVRFAGITAVLVALHWQLASLALVVIPLLALLGRFFVRRLRPAYGAVRQRVGALNAMIENNLSGITVIKAATAEPAAARRVQQASDELRDRRLRVVRMRSLFYPSMSALNWLSFTALLVIGGIWYLDGPPGPFTAEVSVGVLTAFLLYNQQLTTPMLQAVELVDQYHEARASVTRLVALDHHSTDVDTVEPTITTPPRGRIDLAGVTYTYPGADGPALTNLSVSIAAGETVGIVGSTGAGKTSFVELLLGFRLPDQGVVRIDGHTVSTIDRRSLRRRIGFVPQESYLFSGTVRDNLTFGQPDATEAELQTALKLARAWEFVEQFPDGLETPVGQRGVQVSGGQRQRLAIARALLEDPPLLIFDEATSHVDIETAALIRRQIDRERTDRTTIIVAHRLAAVRDADRIIVLENGTIVEDGDHETLRDAGGRYAQLVRSQFVDSSEPTPTTTPTSSP